MAITTLGQFGQVRFGESISDAAQPSASTTRKYKLEARSKSGAFLATLPFASSVSVKEVFNQPGTIEFEYPTLKEEADNLVFPNQIYLYDQYGSLMERYHILPSTQSMNEGAYVTKVEGASLLFQTTKDLIIAYEATDAEEKTVKQILQDLFTYQTSTLKLHLGTIDPSIRDTVSSLSVEGKFLFQALQDLYDTIDEGYFYVDPSNRSFHWKLRPQPFKGQEIRLGKNMKGISVKTDHSEIVNRVYIYGSGFGDDKRLSLIDAGMATEYVQDSSSISSYGVLPQMYVMKEITQPEQLKKTGQNILKRLKNPIKYYEVEYTALDITNPLLHSWEKLVLGSEVRIVNSDLGVSTVEKVVEISRNLDNPTEQTITLANRVPDLSNVIAPFTRRVKTLEAAEGGFKDTTKELVETDSEIDTALKEKTADHIQTDPTIQDGILDVVNDGLTSDATTQGNVKDIVNDALDNDSTTQGNVREIVSNGVDVANLSGIPRHFHAADMAAINALGETFRDGDLATTDAGDKAIYVNDAWEDMGTDPIWVEYTGS